jgi:mRNA interferase MazF
MSPFAAGDVVWTDLDPVFGTEQGGRRPAIVLTDEAFNIRDQRSVICPITRNVAPWPTKIVLPEGMKTRGAVLVDQIRSVHRESRSFRFIEKAPTGLLEEVRAVVGELLGIARL